MPTVDFTRIAGNISALNALNSLQGINNQLAIHQTRLASGKRLNEAADDPAGFVMATTFDSRRESMKVVLKAIGDSKNVLATAEGGLRKMSEILVKMKAKALEAKGDTIGTEERTAIFSQLKQYAEEIGNISGQTTWNNTSLLVSGGMAGTSSMQFLTDEKGGTMSVALATGAFDTVSLHIGTDANLTLDTSTNISSTLANIESALTDVKTAIGKAGSFTARLGFKEDQLNVQYTNIEAAYNRIMNANMAEEQVNASKYTILQQTATAMLSQANQAPQFLLSLFR